MKLPALIEPRRTRRSRPAGARGLKHPRRAGRPRSADVAPRGGARIETLDVLNRIEAVVVAPRGGARIETIAQRGRNTDDRVAPRGGARIETISHLRIIALAKRRAPRGRAD